MVSLDFHSPRLFFIYKTPVDPERSTEKAQLCLFGSSKNGFGFRDSDLDICMTLEGHETAEVGVCRKLLCCFSERPLFTVFFSDLSPEAEL